MTKRDFLEKLKTKGELKSQAEASATLDLVIDTIKEVLKEGKDISIQSFGTFSVTNVKERKGTVPGTDKTYVKPAHKAPKFKFAKAVKDDIA